jgi:DNA-binding MarR family transcriptional regulator
MTDGDQVAEIIANWKRERPELDASPIGVFGRIARINIQLDTYLAKFLGKHGLTLGLFDVMAALRRRGAPYRSKPSTLAATSLLTSGGMTGRLDHLEQLGLVRRIHDDEDRRVIFAELTAKGLSLIDNLIEEHLLREADLLRELTPEQQAHLGELLRIVDLSIAEEGKL